MLGLAIPSSLDIRESFTETEGEKLYELVQRVVRPCMRIVEVGSWKGFSTAYLAYALANWNGTVFAVDHWQGSPGGWNVPIAQTQDILGVFRKNMTALNCDYFIKPMVMDSLTAATLFPERSLDLVFIDGDHRYSGISADIKAWLPKLRIGGILCGHDGSTPYSKLADYVQAYINNHCDDDYYAECQLHPGITKALYELLGDRQRLAGSTRVWYWQKTVKELLLLNSGIWGIVMTGARLRHKLAVYGAQAKQRIRKVKL